MSHHLYRKKLSAAAYSAPTPAWFSHSTHAFSHPVQDKFSRAVFCKLLQSKYKRCYSISPTLKAAVSSPPASRETVQQSSSLLWNPIRTTNNDIHIIWSNPDEVDWAKYESEWLQELPSDEQLLVQAAQDIGTRRRRLLARAMQRAAVAAALPGYAAAMCSSSQNKTAHSAVSTVPAQPCSNDSLVASSIKLPHLSSLMFSRNAHGKPFVASDTASKAPTLEDSPASAGTISSRETGIRPGYTCIWQADTSASTSEASSQASCCSEASPSSTGNATNLANPMELLNDNSTGLQFNLTHTQGLVGIALAPSDIPLGLDVEILGRAPKSGVMSLAKRRFAAEEVAAFQACPDDASRSLLFSQLWSLKEAFVKARGSGISAAPGLKGFAIGVNQGHSEQRKAMLSTMQCLTARNASDIMADRAPVSNINKDVVPNGSHVSSILTLKLKSGCPALLHQHNQQSSVNNDATFQSQRQKPTERNEHHQNGMPGTMSVGDRQTEMHACQQVQPQQRACGLTSCYAPSYKLLLMQPSDQHVAALCLALPRHRQRQWPRPHQSVSQLPPDVLQVKDQDRIDNARDDMLRVHFWWWTPGQGLKAVSSSFSTAGVPNSHNSDGRNRHRDVIVTGCSL